MADFDPFDPKLNQSLKTDKKEEEQQESPDTFQFGEFALTPDAEDNQEVGGLTAGGAVAHKVYIRNTGTDKTKGFKIFLAESTDDTEEIGTLFGQDWMLMPWLATDANEDIMVLPSSSDKMTLEYAVFFQ